MSVLDQFVARKKESFQYTIEITKPFGGIDFVIGWCMAEMLGDWRWQVLELSSDISPGRYCFYFDSSQDYCAFLLKWKD